MNPSSRAYLRFHFGAAMLLTLAQVAYMVDMAPVAIALFSVLCLIVFATRVIDSDMRQSLIAITVYAYPFSFISILGGSYSDLPISLFNVAFVFLLASLIAYGLAAGYVRANYVNVAATVCTISMVVGVTLSFLSSPSSYAWASEALTMLIYFTLPLVTLGRPYWGRRASPLFLLDAFAFTMVSIALALLLQRLVFGFGVTIGSIRVLPSRTILLGLLSDSSHASVALAAGAAIFLLRRWQRGVVVAPWPLEFVLGAICVLGSASTLARAGIASLMVCGILLIVARRVRLSQALALAGLLAPVGLAATALIVANRALVDDTLWNAYSRLPLLRSWVSVISDQGAIILVTGLGLGSENHALVSGSAALFTPHNIILEALLNGGVWMLGFLALPVVLMKAHWRNPAYLAGLLVIIVGSMVSPSTLASRYFPVYLLIGVILGRHVNREQHLMGPTCEPGKHSVPKQRPPTPEGPSPLGGRGQQAA